MDVRMPDGTGITNVPDNITQEDLLERYSRFSRSGQPSAPEEGIIPSLVSGAKGLVSRFQTAG